MLEHWLKTTNKQRHQAYTYDGTNGELFSQCLKSD